MPKSPHPFGSQLSELRKRCGLSQEGFANQLGCKRTYVSQLERSLKMPSDKRLSQLIRVLKPTLSEAGQPVQAAIRRGPIPLPDEMPLQVRQQLVRLIQHKDLSDLASWSLLRQKRSMSSSLPIDASS